MSLGQAAAYDGASDSPLARDRPWPGVGARDTPVFCQLDLKQKDVKTGNLPHKVAGVAHH